MASATPTREKDRLLQMASNRDQKSFHRSFASPSGSQSSFQTSGSTSLSSSQVISVDALLKIHEAAQDPKSAALDQAVNDRNISVSQNAQLWKIIEKQRSGYNQILKELERVRAERDSYKNKVLALGGTTDQRSKSSDRTVMSIVDAADASTNPQLTVSRHHSSDDNETARSQSFNLHSSRSQEPLSQRTNNPLQSNANLTSISTSHAQIPPFVAPSVSPINSKPPKPSLTSLVVSQRPDFQSMPMSSSKTLSPEEMTSNPGHSQYHKDGFTESGNSVSSGNTIPVVSVVQYTLPQQPSAPTVPSDIQITTSPVTPQTAGPQIQAANLPAISDSQADPRISRITLSDETSRQYANMAASPVPSPKHNAVFVTSTAGPKPRVSSNLVPQQQQQREGEFLNSGSEGDGDGDEVKEDTEEDENGDLLYGEDEDEMDLESVQDRTKLVGLDNNHSTTTPSVSDQQSLSGASPHTSPLSDPADLRRQAQIRTLSYSQMQWQKSTFEGGLTRIAGGGGGQVPPGPQSLINNTDSALSPSSQYHPTRSQSQQAQQTGAALTPAQTPPHGEFSLSNPADMPSSTLSSFTDMRALQSQRDPQYRALPLLSSDLPTTLIQVSQSLVRPNDRGKEVLSFVIIVHPNPVNPAKEPWKVEKMYSDVVALDARVRGSVGKATAKKIVSLPEGKLWKDHAPAKVDHRKAILESYLQSLVKLSSHKSNDEVIAFLTSDIVREARQPVMQAGHKEGYLTKRGKNFGGWKTRYFVLSGPVLEYYESRGGAHLGSITITGAQIGRQQRSSNHHSSSTHHHDAGGGHSTDEKEYRHAFLIVEARKAAGGSHPRHVLCAESDEERDAWVDMLVRYFTGKYSEEPLSVPTPQTPVAVPPSLQLGSATGSDGGQGGVLGPAHYSVNVDEYSTNSNPNSNRSASPIKGIDPSPVERSASFQSRHPNVTSANNSNISLNSSSNNISARKILDRLPGLPSSLPDPSSSPLFAAASSGAAAGVLDRPNSDLGHYSHPQDKLRKTQSPEQYRKSIHPPTISASQNDSAFHVSTGTEGAVDRSTSPSKPGNSNKVKISGPMNGMPIPFGCDFGGGKDREKEKDKEKEEKDGIGGAAGGNERREKARSRFWPGWNIKTGNVGEKQIAALAIPRSVFGVPLDESLDVSQICNLPSIVFRCIEYLEAKKADQEEGIYRLSGSTAVIKSLKDRFNAEGDVNLLASDEYWDPHAIAGLLKSYLRDLPASILTKDLHYRFLTVIDLIDAQDRIRELSQLISLLPLANYSLLRALTAHLISIVQNAVTNKMTMRNVGIVFSPTLGIPAGVLSLMLGEFNLVFNVDAGKEPPNESEETIEGNLADDDTLRRNSRQYFDTATDQILGLVGRSLNVPTDDVQSEAEDCSVQDNESETETTESASMSSGTAAIFSTPVHDDDQFDAPHMSSSKSSKVGRVMNSKLVITPTKGLPRISKIPGLPASPRPPSSPTTRPTDTATPSV